MRVLSDWFALEPRALAATQAHLRPFRQVKLGPITGRKNHGFINALQLHKLRQRPIEIRHPSKHDLFANFDRRRVMVQPENVQRHVRWGPG